MVGLRGQRNLVFLGANLGMCSKACSKQQKYARTHPVCIHVHMCCGQTDMFSSLKCTKHRFF